ncbi:MAG TPA: CHRD domain-containing protein [Gemmatimonadaceae bacterium]
MRPALVRMSISVAVLSAAVVWSCTGDTGPAGPDGSQGLQGPQGPQGPAGPAGTALVETFTAALSGANEVATPPVVSTGAATAVITYVGGQLLFRLDVNGTSNVTRAHIHGPAAVGVNAGIRVNFYEPPAGTTPLNFTGTATLANGVAGVPSGITMDSVLVLMRNGNAYVNLHTSTYPSGELRGQIVKVQ